MHKYIEDRKSDPWVGLALPKKGETMDIKKKIDEIVSKVKSDKGFAAKFKSDPVKAIESLLGVDLPDEQVKKLVDGVKAKLSLDKAGGLLGKIKKLF